MKQKVIKVGNSYAVTLPAKYVQEKEIRVGDTVDVNFVKESTGVYEATQKTKLTPEFKKWLDEIGEKYKDTIKELANL